MFIMYLMIYVGMAFDFDASQDLSRNPNKTNSITRNWGTNHSINNPRHQN